MDVLLGDYLREKDAPLAHIQSLVTCLVNASGMVREQVFKMCQCTKSVLKYRLTEEVLGN